jgi:lipopolysaccharide transport system ATP-binding protein
MSSEIAIEVKSLSKCYRIYEQAHHRLLQMIDPREKQYYREFWALDDISFQIKKGETVGIIGRNGSGKSTLLQLICGILNPTTGEVVVRGRIAALLELGSGFNPEFTGLENIFINGSVLGLSNEEIAQRLDEIVAFADIGDFINQPTKTYSSGMLVRLAFAVAINVAPEILIIDEALAVGDAAFQRKCLRKINELSDGGVTLLFVSHDIESIRKICSRAVYLRQGSMMGLGLAKDICMNYERDMFGVSQKISATPDNATDLLSTQPSSSSLAPEFLDVNEKVYGDGSAEISNILITNKYNQEINLIEQGEDLIISYNVNFLAFAEKPIFGMMVTNREGVCIFGVNTSKHAMSIRNYALGDAVKIEFYLRNNLAPGVYYLTCGVHSASNEAGLMYLQRRMDTKIFKSLQGIGLLIGGSANLFPRVQNEILTSKLDV